MRVITFSRVFPSYHPRRGECTYFVEKIVGGLVANDVEGCTTELIKSLRDSKLLSISVMNELSKQTYGYYKHHTIRAGHRWKVGDWFSPRVWSGKPYNSKQIQFAPDIQVKKVWNIEMIKNGYKEFYVDAMAKTGSRICHIAMNDGLTTDDLFWWFNKPFTGQIICWNENIDY